MAEGKRDTASCVLPHLRASVVLNFVHSILGLFFICPYRYTFFYICRCVWDTCTHLFICVSGNLPQNVGYDRPRYARSVNILFLISWQWALGVLTCATLLHMSYFEERWGLLFCIACSCCYFDCGRYSCHHHHRHDEHDSYC